MVGEELYSIDPISAISAALGMSKTIAIAIFMIIAVWEIIWKAIGLWKSARSNHRIWFVLMLVFNTVGILPILYIYLFSRMKFDKKSGKDKDKEKADKKDKEKESKKK